MVLSEGNYEVFLPHRGDTLPDRAELWRGGVDRRLL